MTVDAILFIQPREDLAEKEALVIGIEESGFSLYGPVEGNVLEPKAIAETVRGDDGHLHPTLIVVTTIRETGARSVQGAVKLLEEVKAAGLDLLVLDDPLLDTRTPLVLQYGKSFLGVYDQTKSVAMKVYWQRRGIQAMPACEYCGHPVILRQRQGGGHLRDPRTREPGMCTSGDGCRRYKPRSKKLMG